MNKHTRSSWLLVVVFSLAACRVADETTGSQPRLASNRLASNRLASNRLASNRLASNQLAAYALSSNRLVATDATKDILSTADGREVYSYIVSCALADGTTIEADVPGAPDTAPPDTAYTCSNEHCLFLGAIGLATSWSDHKLSPAGQGWVTACLLARVNANGLAEAISLRGKHPALTVGGEEQVVYTGQEGAFYGNVFADPSKPLDWSVCAGRDAAEAQAQARDCTAPDPNDRTKSVCGFTLAGDCADFSPQFPSPYACVAYDATTGAYDDCHATSGNGDWAKSPKYDQVITTYFAE